MRGPQYNRNDEEIVLSPKGEEMCKRNMNCRSRNSLEFVDARLYIGCITIFVRFGELRKFLSSM